MNLEKDQSIVEFINELTNAIGKNNFQLVDHWDADLCAIGISAPDNPDKLVYVSTFGKQNKFFASTEFPNNGNDEKWKDHPYIPGADTDDLTCDELIDLIREHINKS
jgi:hypothetical protein